MSQVSAKMVKELREETKASMMQCKKALVESQGEKLQAVKLLKEWGMSLVSRNSDRATNEGGIILHNFSINDAALICVSCETDFVAKSQPFQEFCSQIKVLLQTDGMNALQSSTVQELIQEITGKCGEKIALGMPLTCQSQGVIGTYLHSTGKIAALVELQCPQHLWNNEKICSIARDLAMQVVAMSPIAVSLEKISGEVQQEQRSIFVKQMEESGKPPGVIEKIVEGKLKKYFSEICLLSMPFVKDSSVSVEQLLTSCGNELGYPIKVDSFQRLQVGK